MTIAVTGATGFVGQALMDIANLKEIPVRALVRRQQLDRKGVTWVHGDLANRKALRRLMEGVEAVIHVAGVVNAPDAAGFEAGNVQGTLAVVEAALAAGVPRFIFVSSLAAREPHLSAYCASKSRAEKIVAASGLDWTIVRPPAVYGPRDTEMFELFRSAKWGVVPMPPPGRASVIHVDDLAALLLALLPGGEDVTHKVFEPDDGQGEGWGHRELADAIGGAVGRRPWVPHLSRAALDRVSRLESFFRREKSKLTADRISYMTHPDWVVNPERSVPRLRWRPRVRTLDGLKATADWYRKQGWL
ncbi:putative epimerase [Caenibius tardaugens NBRC 16725]|uniref:Putative epimerase n=1 Tax=Caenibius tardaugens NBRC 16725 TaxID=1219035 RepID=U2ZVU4_9SPHN|nr:NAD(P)H-binding protein [Caenibius tardaugens]AZI36814.1 NAD-dependent epimerase/dehydratase family protein [Caenibius tardaugens NBRC 16725]GAD49494.1 putative epimerase [Caenibius tardaugens NBRC 16725]